MTRGSRRELRLLWVGQTASLLGDQVTLLALPLAALATGASVSQVALLAAVAEAPFLVIGLPAGVWVTRIGLRRSMVFADVLRAAALASIPIASLLGTVTFEHLVLVAAAIGGGAVFFQVAYQSLTPLLVDSTAALRSANVRLSASEAFSLIAGPAVAGVLIGAAGAFRAIAVDALTFVGSAGTVAAVRAPLDRPTTRAVSVGAQVVAGVRYVLATPVLAALLWSSILFNAGIAGYQALLVAFAVQHLGLSPIAIGLAIGVGGAGVPIGMLLSGLVERRFGTGVVLIVSGALSGAGLLGAGSASGSLAPAVIAAGTFVTAVGGGAWGLTSLTTRQTLSRSDMRAMMTAVHRWATYGVLPLGALAAGFTASLFGPRGAIMIAAGLAQTCVLPLLVPAVRNLRVLAPPSEDLALG